MIINAVGLNTDANGDIATISVSDGNEVRNVTPHQVFDAILHGRMESYNIMLANKGIQISMNGTNLDIELPIKRVDKQLLNIRLGNSLKKSVSASRVSNKKLEADKKELQLQKEREAYRIKREEEALKQKELVQQAKAKGLINLSPEERLKLRQEFFRNKQ